MAILSFNFPGFSGMLELVRALIPNARSTARAVVVPPGTLSPSTRQSASAPSDSQNLLAVLDGYKIAFGIFCLIDSQ